MRMRTLGLTTLAILSTLLAGATPAVAAAPCSVPSGAAPGPLCPELGEANASCVAYGALVLEPGRADPVVWSGAEARAAVHGEDASAGQSAAAPGVRFPLGFLWVQVRDLHALCFAEAHRTTWGPPAYRLAGGIAGAGDVEITYGFGTVWHGRQLSLYRSASAATGDPVQDGYQCVLADSNRPDFFGQPDVPCAGSTGPLPALRVELGQRWGPEPNGAGLQVFGGAALHLRLVTDEGTYEAYVGYVAVAVRPLA